MQKAIENRNVGENKGLEREGVVGGKVAAEVLKKRKGRSLLRASVPEDQA